MTLRIDDKRAIVDKVKQVADSALSAVVADYRGVAVGEMTELRKQARAENVYLHVVRNTLLRRAVVGTDYECLTDTFTGPTIIAFAESDPGAPARLLKKFSKEHEDFNIKGLAISGQAYPGNQIDMLASLPTYEEALAQLAAVTLGTVTKLVRTLNDVPGRVVRVTNAVAMSKSA